MQSDFQKVIEVIANSSGDDFFNAMTLVLNKTIKADFTYIACINDDESSAKTIALVTENKKIDNIEYSLIHSPCADLAKNSTYYYPDNVCKNFPEDKFLSAMKIKAFLGIPLYDLQHKRIGLLATLYRSPLNNHYDAVALLQMLSGRIAAELMHRNYQRALEKKILARSLALTSTIEQLTLAQQQLVKSEKLASLGGLIAGITHEVNTPLGIAITTHSIITDEHHLLNAKIAEQQLSMKDMQHYCQAVDNALTMQGENLARAKKLIENFKKTAVDQHQLTIETINIKDYYEKVISTLTSILKTKKASLDITGCEHINIATYPGVHAQILTNLITNSVRHGFQGLENNKIQITIYEEGDIIKVRFQDNGIGLSTKVQQHIFEPFFTTATKNGGIGLGMSIVYNLLNEQLNGKICIEQNDQGACFIYQFKANQS